jgi:hypothetical protein
MTASRPTGLALLLRLAGRAVRDLVREITSRVQPALTGGGVARHTQRPGDPLDLSRTVARSLPTVRFRENGTAQIGSPFRCSVCQPPG